MDRRAPAPTPSTTWRIFVKDIRLAALDPVGPRRIIVSVGPVRIERMKKPVRLKGGMHSTLAERRKRWI
jgi:hypothetical protein